MTTEIDKLKNSLATIIVSRNKVIEQELFGYDPNCEFQYRVFEIYTVDAQELVEEILSNLKLSDGSPNLISTTYFAICNEKNGSVVFKAFEEYFEIGNVATLLEKLNGLATEIEACVNNLAA